MFSVPKLDFYKTDAAKDNASTCILLLFDSKLAKFVKIRYMYILEGLLALSVLNLAPK